MLRRPPQFILNTKIVHLLSCCKALEFPTFRPLYIILLRANFRPAQTICETLRTFVPHFDFDMDDFLDNGKILVQKYEMLLYENKAIYFDIDEFKSIAYHYIIVGELDKAMNVALHAERCFPKSVGSEMIRAQVLIDCRKTNEALDLLNRMEKKEPFSSTINILKGKAYLEEERFDDAIQQFDEALRKEEEDKTFLSFNIADTLMEYGEYEPALQFLSGIIEKDTEQSFKAEIYFQAATCYDYLNDIKKAEKLYEKSLDEEPFNDYVWLSLGLLLERAERYDEALQAYDFALTINDKLEPAVLSKASLLMQSEQYDEAIELLTNHITTATYSEYALYYLGECYEYTSNFEQAINYYSSALQQDPEMPDPYWGIGKILKKQGDYENALHSIDSALERDPENADYLFSKGEILLEIGSAIAALEAFTAAAQLCPDDIEILTSIKTTLEKIKLNPDLYEKQQKYAEYPDDIQAIFKLTILYYHTGDLENCKRLIWQITDMGTEYKEKLLEILPEISDNPELNTPPPLYPF